MKKQLTAILTTTLLLAALTGCSTEPANSDIITSSDISTNQSSDTESTSKQSETQVPKGEPTIFVGPDGETIYSSEVTDMEGIDIEGKTVAEITETDYYTSIICEGFQYFTEPSGISYNNYENSELFDDILYIGEPLENKNECKRVNVGDEICGLKLANAVTQFDVQNDMGPNYVDECSFGKGDIRNVAEFEGTITIKGFLGINAPNTYEPDGGYMTFTPTESKLPILADNPEFYEVTNFVAKQYSVYSDMNDIGCGFLQNLRCDTAGLQPGDVAFVSLTLSDIKYIYANTISAEIQNIELLSDVLYHE